MEHIANVLEDAKEEAIEKRGQLIEELMVGG
jgi:hypothetical protein